MLPGLLSNHPVESADYLLLICAHRLEMNARISMATIIGGKM